MVSLCTTLKPLSPFSPFVKKGNPNNTSALLTYHTSNSANSFLPKRGGTVAIHDAPDQVESSWKKSLTEVVMVRKKSAFWERRWSSRDVRNVVVLGGVHLLSLFAPLYFSWAAFRLFVCLHLSIGMCIALSYHRNLSHRSFDLPKWLEFILAYGGALAFQGDPIEWCGGEENVNDLMREPFYRFLQQTLPLHLIAYGFLLYICGGMPFLVWGIGVATVVRLHGTLLVNSVCHTWGTRAWNTPDISKNNWWAAIITIGEGWHNNHHAFEFSARVGLEWWQLDVTWYLISFLEAIGLATNVKSPTEAQKKRMALV
ncbi:hypothetical protein Bca4012_066590 [Brassica carinata]